MAGEGGLTVTNRELLEAILELLRIYLSIEDKRSGVATDLSVNLMLMMDELRMRARGVSDGGKP